MGWDPVLYLRVLIKKVLVSGGQAARAAWLVGENICKPQHPTHICMHMGSQDHPQGTDSLVTTPSHQLSQKALDFLMCEEIYFKTNKQTCFYTTCPSTGKEYTLLGSTRA